jgi:hypothetical protein
MEFSKESEVPSIFNLLKGSVIVHIPSLEG